MSSYVTSSSLTTSLSSYVTSSSLTSTLLGYVTSSSLTSTLSSYATLVSPSFTGTPTIGTNPIAVKPWVSGRFGGVSSGNPNITGTASNAGTGSGTQSFTVTRQAAGTYNINWTTAHPSGSFLYNPCVCSWCLYQLLWCAYFYKLPNLYI
jgi:hypothetical protein